jgi:hypothetical protein
VLDNWLVFLFKQSIPLSLAKMGGSKYLIPYRTRWLVLAKGLLL